MFRWPCPWAECLPCSGFTVYESRGSEGRSHRGEFVDRHFFRQRSSEQRHQGDSVVRAFIRGGFRSASFGDEIEHAVFRRLFSVEFERTIAVGLTLDQLLWSAGARSEKRHGRSGDGT